MQQEKIGKFIAELRKTHGFTQLQLAEQLGVSDKTVSRWETGKGMPEISILLPLCEILEVSANELLLGEYLESDNFKNDKLENQHLPIISLEEKDTMNFSINLMKQANQEKWKNISISIFCFFICIIGIGIILEQGGMDWMFLLDFPSFFMIVIPTMLFLIATGFGKSVWNGMAILFGKKADISQEELIRSKKGITFMASTMFLIGVSWSLLQIVVVFYNWKGENWGILGKNLSVSLFPLFYGMIAFLMLFFMRERLSLKFMRE